MNDAVSTLYQRVILDHHRTPRNFRVISGAAHVEGHNPLCGDRIMVYVQISDGLITDAAFEGVGCAICISSASLMTETVRGKSLRELGRLSQRVHDLVTAAPGAPADDLGALSSLAGVRQFPVRVKCALLPWHTLLAAARGEPQTVSTE